MQHMLCIASILLTQWPVTCFLDSSGSSDFVGFQKSPAVVQVCQTLDPEVACCDEACQCSDFWLSKLPAVMQACQSLDQLLSEDQYLATRVEKVVIDSRQKAAYSVYRYSLDICKCVMAWCIAVDSAVYHRWQIANASKF